MKQLAHDSRGMTVVEVVVAVAVMAMVAGTMTTIFMTAMRLNWKANNNIQSQQNARIGLDALTRDLRQAGRLGPGTSFGGFTFANSCSQISFALPHVKTFNLSDNTPVWAPDIDSRIASPTYGKVPYDGWYVSYYLTATDKGTLLYPSGPYLVRTIWGDLTGTPALSSRTMARNISNLAFSDRSTSACPTTAGREIIVTVVGSQMLADGTTPVSVTTMTQDVTLRNSF
jgi:type II secretory pathway pseudopilin PulG